MKSIILVLMCVGIVLQFGVLVFAGFGFFVIPIVHVENITLMSKIIWFHWFAFDSSIASQ